MNSDSVFAWEGADAFVGPWRHLEVAQFRGVEALSSPYRYELFVLARDPAPEINPDDIVRLRGTLRIATKTDPPFRIVHGIISEAEELGPTYGGMLYRLVLSPPIVRAQHRERCRIFLEKTTRQIIDDVLLGDPNMRRDDGAEVEPDDGDMRRYDTPKALFAWRVTDTSRID